MAEVSYKLSAFKRAKFIGGNKPILLETTDGAEAFTAMRKAITHSNDVMAEAEKDDLFAQMDGPVQTPGGPMAMVRDCEPGKALEMMLQLVAHSLEEQGISGRLRPHPQGPPHRFANESTHPALEAVLLLPVDKHQAVEGFEMHSPHHRWAADLDVSGRVLNKVVDWLAPGPGQLSVTMGGGVRLTVSRDNVMELWLSGLSGHPLASVTYVDDSESRMRQARTSAFGFVAMLDYAADGTRGESHASLSRALREAAPLVTSGFIRECRSRTLSLRQVLASSPPAVPMPKRPLASSWLLAPIQGEYVYDAFVEQVLTSKHIEKTHHLDPSRWSTEQVALDKFIVKHTTPQAWYSDKPRESGGGVGVDDATLQQARADFGDAIMNGETLRQNPPALPRDQQAQIIEWMQL